MKKFIIIAMLIAFVMPSLAIPDVYDQLRGKQMVGDKGATWFADNAVMYFGTGKDVALKYSPIADKFYLNDTDLYFEEDVTIAGNLGVSGTTISNGKTTDPFYVNDLFYVSDTTALNATTATTVVAEDLRSTDDGTIVDDLDVGGLLSVDSLALGSRPVSTDYNFVTTGVDLDPVVMVDARAANRTVTLPLAANAAEKMVIVKAQYLPGSYFVRVNVTTNEHVNGKHLIVSTDDASMFMPSITLYSSGGSWYVLNVYGTWSSVDL